MFVLRSDEVIAVTARFVVVAVPTTVSPLVNVDDAARNPPLKVKSVLVALPGNSYPIVLVITPVDELYAIPLPPESEVEEILLLKVWKSPDER